MSDLLRDILGDRYVETIRAAVLADNPNAIRDAQRVGGNLGKLMYLSAVDRLHRVLAAVLPELLMEARSQGWIAAVASMRYPDGTPVEIVASVNPFRTNPYRIEETDHA